MKAYPPRYCRAFSHHITLASPPQTSEEIKYLHDHGIRKFYLIDLPLTTELRQAGVAYKLELRQWNLAAILKVTTNMDDLAREILNERDKGSNVAILGAQQDLGVICAALALKSGSLELPWAIRKVVDISGPEALTNATLMALDNFDKHIH